MKRIVYLGFLILSLDVALSCISSGNSEPANRVEKSLNAVTERAATTKQPPTTTVQPEVPTTVYEKEEATTNGLSLDERIQAIKDEYLGNVDEDDEDVGEEIMLTTTVETVTDSNHEPSSLSYIAFDWNLIQNVLSKVNSNAILSPYSLKLALMIMYEAAGAEDQRKTTKTAAELSKILIDQEGFNVEEERKLLDKMLKSSGNGDHILDIGTKLFIDKAVKVTPQFMTLINKHYNSEVDNVKFSDAKETVDVINDWSANATHGRIPQLVDEKGIKNIVMLLANALYFKGTWEQKFEPALYGTKEFQLADKTSVEVPYMTQTKRFFFGHSKTLGAKLLQLHYKGPFSMILVLPDTNNTLNRILDSIIADIPKFSTVILDDMYLADGLYVQIPKFKFDFGCNLNNALQNLGIRHVFTDSAEFPLLSKSELKISDVVQKAGIEVNEHGTEAYAATEITIDLRIGFDAEFIADRPFMFFIEDEETRTILFAGKVENPLQTEVSEC